MFTHSILARPIFGFIARLAGVSGIGVLSAKNRWGPLRVEVDVGMKILAEPSFR